MRLGSGRDQFRVGPGYPAGAGSRRAKLNGITGSQIMSRPRFDEFSLNLEAFQEGIRRPSVYCHLGGSHSQKRGTASRSWPSPHPQIIVFISHYNRFAYTAVRRFLRERALRDTQQIVQPEPGTSSTRYLVRARV